MGLFSRQDEAQQRTPEERAHARAVRDARRRGAPEPVPPRRHDEPNDVDAADGVHDAFAPPDVEPAVSRLEVVPPPAEPEPEPVQEPEPDPAPVEEPEPEPEPAARAVEPVRARPLQWDATDEWQAERPQGDPVEPEAPPEPPQEDRPQPADPPRPHGDPLMPDEDDDDEPPAAARFDAPAGNGRARAWGGAPGATAAGPRRRRGLFARNADEPVSALGRQLPPLPARTAARQLPEPPPARRRGGSPPPPARGPEPRHRPRHWGRRFFALLALLIAAAAIALVVMAFQPFHGKAHGTVRVTVPNGATARQIGDLLEQRGVVADGRLFALRAALAGKRSAFKAGGFTLQRDMTYGDAMNALTTNPAAAPTVHITIPEGRARRETAPLVKQAGLSGNYVRLTSVRPPRDLGAPRGATTLEGFLFPASYDLPRRNASAQELVDEQLKAFRENIRKVSMRRARRANLTRYDVLTIASMVEREAQLPRERRIIAAVIYNRLKDGIPLGIDATIRFATRNWSRPLRVSELNLDTPYNTRKHTGLPPTPIGSPGLAAIQAAANPAHVPYLYYVVKPGGRGAHAFSSTDAQFQRDVRRYNAARERNGGRSPAG